MRGKRIIWWIKPFDGYILDFRLFSTSLVEKKDDEINTSKKNNDNTRKSEEASSERWNNFRDNCLMDLINVLVWIIYFKDCFGVYSDSDEEQRFTEAAVSAETILSGSAIPIPSTDGVQRHSIVTSPTETLKEHHFKSTNFEDVNESLSKAQKRRKRRKKDGDSNEHTVSKKNCLDSKSSEHANETVMPRKKRKKKNKEQIE